MNSRYHITFLISDLKIHAVHVISRYPTGSRSSASPSTKPEEVPIVPSSVHPGLELSTALVYCNLCRTSFAKSTVRHPSVAASIHRSSSCAAQMSHPERSGFPAISPSVRTVVLIVLPITNSIGGCDVSMRRQLASCLATAFTQRGQRSWICLCRSLQHNGFFKSAKSLKHVFMRKKSLRATLVKVYFLEKAGSDVLRNAVTPSSSTGWKKSASCNLGESRMVPYQNLLTRCALIMISLIGTSSSISSSNSAMPKTSSLDVRVSSAC